MKLCLLVLKVLSGNLDLANINASTVSFEIPSICSKDIEQKRNSKINQGPQKLVREYDQEVPQSQTADNSVTNMQKNDR